MGLLEMIKQDDLEQTKMKHKNSDICYQALYEYLKSINFSYPANLWTGFYLTDLFNIYKYAVVKGDKDRFIEILDKYKINKSASIRNALYMILGNENELGSYNLLDKNYLIGVDKIEEINDIYKLDTCLGSITCFKASPLFKNTKHSYIFHSPLINRCFRKTEDFMMEDPSGYKAVLAYMPSMFTGGLFHAYLESDSNVLDIASNCFYPTIEDSKIALNGEVVKKMTLEELNYEYNKVLGSISNTDGIRTNKLTLLSLYYNKNR